MALSDIEINLKKELQNTLPGEDAQYRMASSIRERPDITEVSDGSRKSSVLVLIYPDDEELKLVFMKRPEYDGVHSGQISFPGGASESSDRSKVHTALREANEELSIQSSEVNIIGELTPLYIAVSNFLVFPFVGTAKERPRFKAAPQEVADILEIPIDHFLKDEAVSEGKIEIRNGLYYSTPYYIYENEIIWGATAMILSELLQIWARIRNSKGLRC